MIQIKLSLITEGSVASQETKNDSSCFQVFKTGDTVLPCDTRILILQEPELLLVSISSNAVLSFVFDVLLLALKSCLWKKLFSFVPVSLVISENKWSSAHPISHFPNMS